MQSRSYPLSLLPSQFIGTRSLIRHGLGAAGIAGTFCSAVLMLLNMSILPLTVSFWFFISLSLFLSFFQCWSLLMYLVVFIFSDPLVCFLSFSVFFVSLFFSFSFPFLFICCFSLFVFCFHCVSLFCFFLLSQSLHLLFTLFQFVPAVIHCCAPFHFFYFVPFRQSQKITKVSESIFQKLVACNILSAPRIAQA